MNISFLMDVVLAGLLLAMIVHGVMLNRRLTRLREDRDELAAVVRDFQTATGQAVAGLDGIRTAADTTGRALQNRIDEAKASIRDLEFLVERGERAAERLEEGSRQTGRPPVQPAATVPTGTAATRPAPAAPAPDARSLLKAIEGMR